MIAATTTTTSTTSGGFDALETLTVTLPQVALFVAILIGVAFGFGVGIYLLSRTIRHLTEGTDIRVVVIVLLSLLTLVTILVFALTELRDLSTLAGTGLGAIAGAVTAVYTDQKSQSRPGGRRATDPPAPRRRPSTDLEADVDPGPDGSNPPD